MVCLKLAASVVAFALSVSPVMSSSHFIMGGLTPLVYERLDPIVTPDAVGTHVHGFVGANNINKDSTYDTLRQASGTNVPFQGVDLSSYWFSNSTCLCADTRCFVITDTQNIYYFFDRIGPNEKVVAFPAGLKMLAGNPTRTTYNASSAADQAVSFVCLDYSGKVSGNPAYAERQDINFPDISQCEDGTRWQVFFPSCWDGVNLDSADHKSHMAYPSNMNGGSCPSSHPVHLVSIFYEVIVPTQNYQNWGPGAFVLSNGHNSLGFHADFLNGWDVPTLQTAANECHNMNGDINLCQVLVPYINSAKASATILDPSVSIVDEAVGLDGPLNALPGCNPVNGAPCPNAPTPGFRAVVSSLPGGWGTLGCIAEGTNGRALSGASTKANNMTNAVCASYCSAQNFLYAGTEFGTECYCGNSFSNGASGAIVGSEQCSNRCGNSDVFENCGGPQRLTLMKRGAGSSSPATSAAVTTPVVATSASIKTSSASATVVSTSVATTVVPTSAAAPSSVKAASSSVKIASSSVVTSAAAAPSTPATNNTLAATGAPSGWAAVGCLVDSSARALTGFSTSSSSMTPQTCASTCASKGFSMAGVEFGTECYCGNSLANGHNATSDQCNMACGGSNSQTCGGNWAINVFKVASSGSNAVSTSPSSGATTWTGPKCTQDGPARALIGYFTSSASMTVEKCQSICGSKGFSIAGLEFSTECYCGNSFSNGLGKEIDSGRNCYMTAGGNFQQKAGGTWAISTYFAQSSGNTAPAKRSKHFGRVNHYRNSQF
ncbi:WSC-domain-containing protein [Trametopsis cervina]|nr:WSC-domain-containing protein [Trametopsis cervina]